MSEQPHEPPQWALWRGMRLEADMKWRAATPAARPASERQGSGPALANGTVRVGGATHEY